MIGGIIGGIGIIVGTLARAWKWLIALTVFSYLRGKFCRQPKAIQLIIEGILALVPSGLI